MNNQWQKQERYYQSNCIEFLFEVGIRECVVVLHCYAFITLNTRSQNITCSIVFLVWMISFSQVNVHSLNDEVLDVWNGCGDVWHFLFFYSIEFPLAATSDCFQLKPFSGTKNIYLWILDSSHVLLIFHKFNATILITTITIFNEKSDGLFGCWCLRFKRQALSQSVSQAASATVSFLHSISQ